MYAICNYNAYNFDGGMEGPDQKINKSYLFRRIRICPDELAICSDDLAICLDK